MLRIALFLPLGLLLLGCASDSSSKSGPAPREPGEHQRVEAGSKSDPSIGGPSKTQTQKASSPPPPIAPLAGDRCLPVVACQVPQRRCEMVKQSPAPLANPKWELVRVFPGDKSDATVRHTFDVIETRQRCRRRPLHTASPLGCVAVGGSCATRAGPRDFAPECSRAIGSATVAVARVWAGKPPAKTVYLDLTINNRSESARWFLLGDRVDDNWVAQASRVSVHNLPSAGGELYLFHGQDGFLAVRVAARSTLKLTDVPTRAFGDVPNPLYLQLVTVGAISTAIDTGATVTLPPIEAVVGRKLKGAAGRASANYRDLKPTGKGNAYDSPHTPHLASANLGPVNTSGLRDEVPVVLTGPCSIAMGPPAKR